MKKLYYLILALYCNVANLVYSCPFKITNDGNLDIVVVEHKSLPEEGYYIEAGVTLEIPGFIAPQTYAWVYMQEKMGSNKFILKYGILEYACIEEGESLPHLIYSTFEDRAKRLSNEENLEIEPDLENYLSDEEFEENLEEESGSIEVAYFDDLLEDDPDEFKDVPRAIIMPARISTLTRLSASFAARLIKEGRLTIEQLKQKTPEELVEMVESYLKSE